MIGGYTVVAAALNTAYVWPGGREISRQQVQAWDVRRTLNKLQQLPPSAVEENPEAGRTQPTRLHETREWIEWARPGVPGPHSNGQRGQNWAVPRPREGYDTPWPGWQAQHRLPVRPRHRDPVTGHWVITHPNRKPVPWPPVERVQP